MVVDVLLAVTTGFVLGRALDKYRDADTRREAVEQGGADEKAGEAVAERAPARAAAAEIGEQAAVQGTVVTLNAQPAKKPTEIDMRRAIMDVLSSSREPMTLAVIAKQMEKQHFAQLIGPMRSLLDMGEVVKDDKTYRLA